ncbi:MAG: bifunctional 5,10-methylenetetrahydrofolate dehydrogenase/5,10-methenyltetrahydrofolate cyclohydrolase [Candidatus Moraniibacteriota bacterium]
MNILDGKQIGETILQQLAEEVETLSVKPRLGVILVGDNPASHIYVRLKERAAERVGIIFEKKIARVGVTKGAIEGLIQQWNADPAVTGILLQLPLPDAFRDATDELITLIDPDKDVDGFHLKNTERFLAGDTAGVYPVFPRAIMELIKASQQPFIGKQAAIVCNSMRFGEMMSEALRRENIQPEIILQQELLEGEKKKEMTQKRIKNADIVITACGVPNLLRGEDIKSGAIVIDGGIAQLPDGKIVGDVNRESTEMVEGYLSPVPGGVGPVTVACLLRNVVELAKQKTDA